MDELCGVVESITFRNEDNGFTVLELLNENADDEHVTAVGVLASVHVGEKLLLTGEWTAHAVYGDQFKIATVRLAPLNTLDEIERYLGSGLIKGVGPATAKRIVRQFGLETFDVLSYTPHRLSEIPGLGSKRAQTIAEGYIDQRGQRDIMMALQAYGLTVTQALKLYKSHGEGSLALISQNPYQLIDEVPGIGFKTADRIAQQMGVASDSPFRLGAGIRYMLAWARNEGHVYLPRDVLVESSASTLETDIAPLEQALLQLQLTGDVVVREADGHDAVYLPSLYRHESDSARRMLMLLQESEPPPPQLLQTVDAVSDLEGIVLAPMQREAVLLALSSGVLVITGGPGTGKTTIVRVILRLLERMHMRVALAAPTGRAAKRLSEATGGEASTIHRLLEYGRGEEAFNRGEDNPLDCDVLIVDEASMLDIILFHHLLEALTPQTRLLLVGDVDQLPSVGPGAVLSDIIASGCVPVMRLTEIYRQAQQSAIVLNAHRVNDGEAPELHAAAGDFVFEEIADTGQILKRVVQLCLGARRKGLDPLRDVQVLSPMKKGVLGVYSLNAALQHALNPPHDDKAERNNGSVTLREGDKVMQIRNDYRLEWLRSEAGLETSGTGVFNGDTGQIISIQRDVGLLTVLFDDERMVHYDFADLDALDLAYCVSIHKSQGNEFPIVILPLAGGPPMLLTRNLLYTAITRAKKQVIICGRSSTVLTMTRNTQRRERYTSLALTLRSLADFMQS